MNEQIEKYLSGMEAWRADRLSRFQQDFLDELDRAEIKHPSWCCDAVHGSAILAEESGELTQAAIDFHYNGGSEEDRKRMRAEAIQCGAMALRFLLALDNYKPQGQA